MTTRTRRASLVAAGLACALLTGCSGYWKVTDTRHGDVYYTNEKPSARPDTGLVRFVDAGSGATITLDRYEIERADKKQVREQVIVGHPEG